MNVNKRWLYFSIKIAKDMERWAKKQAKSKEAGRPQATAQATQDATKESTYQYDPSDLKVRLSTILKCRKPLNSTVGSILQ